MDDIVFLDDEYAIARLDRPFGTGFNVYRLGVTNEKGVVPGTKINNHASWFKTVNAAYDWLKAYRSEATD